MEFIGFHGLKRFRENWYSEYNVHAFILEFSISEFQNIHLSIASLERMGRLTNKNRGSFKLGLSKTKLQNVQT